MKKIVLPMLFAATTAGFNLCTGTPVVHGAPAGPEREFEYRLLATNKTSTMQKEMNEAAGDGFRFAHVMGGETAAGGNEAVVMMSRTATGDEKARYEYKLLAANKTSTMEKELREAGNDGFEYRGQSVFRTAFGGREVVVILERNRDGDMARREYKLLATNKTSTMQKELTEAAKAGFQVLGLTVAETAFGGREVVCILSRKVEP